MTPKEAGTSMQNHGASSMPQTLEDARYKRSEPVAPVDIYKLTSSGTRPMTLTVPISINSIETV